MKPEEFNITEKKFIKRVIEIKRIAHSLAGI
jgi:hypothetical protein